MLPHSRRIRAIIFWLNWDLTFAFCRGGHPPILSLASWVGSELMSTQSKADWVDNGGIR